jgi:hypothetical protein
MVINIRLIFIILLILGFIYFFLFKRKFDFFSIAYASSVIYFIPGVLGFTRDPVRRSIIIEISNKTYIVMSLVLISIIIGGFIFQIYGKSYQKRDIKIVKDDFSGEILLLMSVLGFIISIFIFEGDYFSIDKMSYVKKLGRIYILWMVSASISSVLFFIKKRYILFSISFSFLFLDMLIGFRSYIFMTILSIIILTIIKNKKEMFLIKNLKYGLLSIIIGAIFFIYKGIYPFVKAKDIDKIVNLLTDKSYYLFIFLNSEPFNTQVILNSVLNNNFKIGMDNLKGLLYQFIIFSNNLGGENISFNDLFQSELFPTREAGLGSNIWAQMWSSQGWFLLGFFILFYIIVIFILNIYFNRSKGSLKGIISIIASYWIFYIHRNDLNYIINIIKRFFLIFLFSIILSYLISSIKTGGMKNK